MMRKLSTRNQLIILLLVSMFVLTAGIVANSSFNEASNLISAERLRSQAITGSVQTTIQAVGPIIRTLEDIPELDNRLQDLVDNNEGIDFIAVTWPDGTVLYHSTAELKGSIITDLVDLPEDETTQHSIEGFDLNFLTRTTYDNPVTQGEESYNIIIGAAVEPFREQLFETLIQTILTGLAIMLVISVVMLYLLRRLFTQPLQRLTAGARIFSAGDLDYHIDSGGGQELVELTDTMNQMAVDLQRSRHALETVNMSLEQRVRERTRDIMTVARLAAESATILDTSTLLKSVSDQTKQDFNFYHAHIYLYNAEEQALVLAAGAGTAGEQMVATGHRIPLNRETSLVARAARTREIVVVDDVRRAPDFMPNPLLPETRSELAVALIARDELIGVLDVQDNKSAAFDNEIRAVMETLAQLVSVAVSNARLFEEVERASRNDRVVGDFAQKLQTVATVSDVLTLAATELGEAFPGASACVTLGLEQQPALALAGENGNGAGLHTPSRENYDENQLEIYDQWHTYIEKMSPTGTIGCTYDLDGTRIHEGQNASSTPSANSFSLSRPISVYNVPLGNINLGGNGFVWSEDEITLVDNIAERLALAIEEIRSRDLTREVLASSLLQTRRLAQLNDLTAEIEAAQDIQSIYRIAARYTQSIVGTDRASVAHLSEDGTQMEVFGLSGSEGAIPMGAHLPLEGSAMEQALHNRRPFYVRDLKESIHFVESQALSDQGLGSTVALPLIIDGEPRGTLNVGRAATDAFSEEEVGLLAQIAAHLATNLENHQLLVNTERRASELQTVAEVSTQVTTILDVDELLWTVTNLTCEAFRLYHAHIYLYNEQTSRLELAAGAGEAGRQMAAAGHNIPFNSATSLVATAARTQQPVIVNDVTQAPNFLPNPLLPNTQSEMTVPMLIGRKLIGVLDVQADTFNRFAEDDMRVMITLAGQIAVAVNNATLFSEVENDAKTRAQLHQISQELAESLDPQVIAQAAVEGVINILNVPSASLLHYDADTNHFVRLAAVGEIPEQIGDYFALNLEDVPELHKLIATHQVIQVPDLSKADPIFDPVRNLGYTAALILPIMLADQLAAVLAVTETGGPREFSEQEIMVAQSIGVQTAVALQNAYQFKEQVAFADQLLEVDRIKSEFLASMSHELRTPLNSIIGYAEVLLDGIDGDLTDDMQEDIDAIHGSGKHLLSLINDVLDLAKIEAQQLDLINERVELHEFIHDVVNSSRVLVKDKPVEMLIDIPEDVPDLKADPLRLRQILSNLLSNAAKFTTEGSITIHARRNGENPDMVTISVQDTGMGINAESLPLVFDRFRQVDQSATRRHGGTGLGLAITRELVEMHGGEIWAQSKPGTGSIFTFTMPAALD